MKNVQVVDGADNATFSIFRATDDEFAYLFPGPGQDIEFVGDFAARHHKDHVEEVLGNLWLRPIHKRNANGIDGTLFFDRAGNREHIPASKREIDREPLQINAAQRELYAVMRAAEDTASEAAWPATTRETLEAVPGGPQLLELFGGRIPSFHDAEILTLLLDREQSRCALRVHTFEMTSDVDERGFFILKNHVVVSFQLEGVVHLELQDFNEQNAIYGLSISRTADSGFRVELDRCHGLFGFVEAREMTIELEPGKPADGVYSSNAD